MYCTSLPSPLHPPSRGYFDTNSSLTQWLDRSSTNRCTQACVSSSPAGALLFFLLLCLFFSLYFMFILRIRVTRYVFWKTTNDSHPVTFFSRHAIPHFIRYTPFYSALSSLSRFATLLPPQCRQNICFLDRYKLSAPVKILSYSGVSIVHSLSLFIFGA